jgi:hypothetical protein
MKSRKTDTGQQQQSLAGVPDEVGSPPLPLVLPKISKPNGQSGNGSAAEAGGAGSSQGKRIDPEAENTSRAALDELLGKAEALPNIDGGRDSVLSDAPVNLEHEGREAYEEEEEAAGGEARWGRPNNQEFVWVDPAPDHSRILACVKAKKGGALYPVSQAMLEKYPELRYQARRYLVRTAVTSVKEGSETIRWPVPLAGAKDAPSDPSHRLAQKNSMKEWLRTEWDGNRFRTYRPKNPQSYGQPKWPDESFDDLLRQAIDDVVIRDETHEFVIQLLGL